MKRIDYTIPRSLFLFFGGFWFVGSLPRMLGIITTKPEYSTVIPIVDMIATVGFFSSVFYVVYALVHNARLPR